MSYQGSYASGTLIYWIFATTENGVPVTFSDSPAVSIYKNSTTQSTAGVTLTVDYDGITGQNQIKIDTSSDTSFYEIGAQFSAVISAGTVAGETVVGRPVGSFSIQAESIASVGSVSGGGGGAFGGAAPLNRPRALHPGDRA